MKKKLILISFFTLTNVYSQVGIGTEAPNATLEIKVDPSTISTPTLSPPGFITPKLSGDELKLLDPNYLSSQTGAIVFVTSIPTGDLSPRTIDITSDGFYYFNGTKWVKLGSGAGNGTSTTANPWFYAPPILLPTSADSDILGTNYTYSENGGIYSVNLYQIYNSQFTNALKPENAPILVPDTQNDLDFYVTYYDPNVFENVTISDLGVLSYTIKPTDPPTTPVTNPVNGIITEKTFMNIIFKKK